MGRRLMFYRFAWAGTSLVLFEYGKKVGSIGKRELAEIIKAKAQKKKDTDNNNYP